MDRMGKIPKINFSTNKKGTFSGREDEQFGTTQYCITLTFGDQAENHAGMQKVGEMVERGLSYFDLMYIKYKFERDSHLYNLSKLLPKGTIKERVGFLVIKNRIDFLHNLTTEIVGLQVDTKAFMKGRVVNKRARYNLCFADFDQEPDYESKRGRIINFRHLPYLSEVLKLLRSLSEKIPDLVAEENLYYDVNECGIGFHGDSERKIVIGCRLGANMPLYYQWYKEGEKVGKLFEVELEHGDIYIMSEKATGFDWKKRKIFTLRHAAGSKKYTKINK